MATVLQMQPESIRTRFMPHKFPYTDSWWNGANVPGKKEEVIEYVASIKHYETRCRANIEKLQRSEMNAGENISIVKKLLSRACMKLHVWKFPFFSILLTEAVQYVLIEVNLLQAYS